MVIEFCLVFLRPWDILHVLRISVLLTPQHTARHCDMTLRLANCRIVAPAEQHGTSAADSHRTKTSLSLLGLWRGWVGVRRCL